MLRLVERRTMDGAPAVAPEWVRAPRPFCEQLCYTLAGQDSLHPCQDGTPSSWWCIWDGGHHAILYVRQFRVGDYVVRTAGRDAYFAAYYLPAEDQGFREALEHEAKLPRGGFEIFRHHIEHDDERLVHVARARST